MAGAWLASSESPLDVMENLSKKEGDRRWKGQWPQMWSAGGVGAVEHKVRVVIGAAGGGPGRVHYLLAAGAGQHRRRGGHTSRSALVRPGRGRQDLFHVRPCEPVFGVCT